MRWDILKIPNPGKWEKFDYFCLGCVWIILPSIRIMHELHSNYPTNTEETARDTLFWGLMLFFLQVSAIFPFLQLSLNYTSTYFFDRWLVKSTNEDGNEWTHAQGTMTFAKERKRNNEGPDIIIYNVTSSYIVQPLVDIDGNGDDKEEYGVEISESQEWMTIPQSTEKRYQRMDRYTGKLPKWMKSVGLDEKNSNVVARFPMRVLKRDPSFAVVYSATSINDSSQILFPDRTSFGLFCSISVFFDTTVGLGFVIFYSPLLPIEIFFINIWMIVQLIWGCSLGLAFHVNCSKYKPSE